jgi:hypothetical protein
MASSPLHSPFWVVLTMFLSWVGSHLGNHCPFYSPFIAPAPEAGPGPQGLREEKALVGGKK